MPEEQTKINPEAKAENQEPAVDSLLEKSLVLAERLEAANQRAEEITRKQEQLMARQMLSGRADAGHQPEKPKEETPSEYAKRIMRGGI